MALMGSPEHLRISLEAERGQAVNCEDPVEPTPEDQEKFGDLG